MAFNESLESALEQLRTLNGPAAAVEVEVELVEAMAKDEKEEAAFMCNELSPYLENLAYMRRENNIKTGSYRAIIFVDHRPTEVPSE